MAHNLVYFDSSTNSIQQFSNAQLDDLAERVLRVMASGTYTGSITVGTSNPIGTFADTALVDAAGGANTTVVTNTYTLSQVSTATLGASSDPPMHVGLDVSNPTTTVLQENLTTKEQLADEIISRMVASTGGTNAYYLGTSAPADGATWVSRGTLLDTITNLTVTVTDYKLWQRTTSGASITNRDPVKLSSGNIQSFTTAEIEALIKTIEERIVATGVGTYVLQQTAPGTGTWTNVGTVTDTREDIATSNFTSPESYINENAIGYTSTYTGTITYTNEDATPFSANYIGAVTYLGTANFTNPDVTPFSTTYLGPVTYSGPANFINPNVTPFTSTYLGPASFSGPVSYTNENANSFNRNFLGPTYNQQFNAPLGSGTYVGPGSTAYILTYFREFNAAYTTTYLGPVTYTGTASFTNPNATPFNSPSYLGPVTYTGDDGQAFINPDGASFVSPTYLGSVTYTGEDSAPFTNPDATSFVSPNYLGPANFTSAPTDFTGPNYSGSDTYDGTASYEGTRVGGTTSTISTRTLWRRVA